MRQNVKAAIGAFKPANTVESPLTADTGKAIACDLCQGEPKCIEACPEEALEIVESDEAAEKLFNDALEKLPAQTEQLTTTVKNKDWKPLLSNCREKVRKSHREA